MKNIIITIILLFPLNAYCRSSYLHRQQRAANIAKEEQDRINQEAKAQERLELAEQKQKLKKSIVNPACMRELVLLKEDENIGPISGTKKELYNLSLVKSVKAIVQNYLTLTKGQPHQDVSGVYNGKAFYTMTKKYNLLHLTFIDESEIEVAMSQKDFLAVSETCKPKEEMKKDSQDKMIDNFSQK